MKIIKLLGILFRFVEISIIANYFFTFFDSKKKALYKCVFHFIPQITVFIFIMIISLPHMEVF